MLGGIGGGLRQAHGLADPIAYHAIAPMRRRSGIGSAYGADPENRMSRQGRRRHNLDQRAGAAMLAASLPGRSFPLVDLVVATEYRSSTVTT
jgi:hypothetical protein